MLLQSFLQILLLKSINRCAVLTTCLILNENHTFGYLFIITHAFYATIFLLSLQKLETNNFVGIRVIMLAILTIVYFIICVQELLLFIYFYYKFTIC